MFVPLKKSSGQTQPESHPHGHQHSGGDENAEHLDTSRDLAEKKAAQRTRDSKGTDQPAHFGLPLFLNLTA
jgi:hypothetical protein